MPTASPRDTSLVTTARVDLRDNDVALGVSGNHAENLKAIERRLGVRVGQRGTELHLSGPADAVASAVRLVEQLETILRAGQPVGREDVEQGLKMLGRGGSPEQGLDTLVLGPVLSRAGRHVAPKSLAQKRYVDAIRRHDIVFGIGPAGTGKTYLAMAMAVAALQAQDGEAHHPRPSGGGGRREAGVPPRRPGGEGEPVPAARSTTRSTT